MSTKPTINFASENYAGVQPDMMKALADANHGLARSYGNDEYTAEAIDELKNTFGNDIDVYFAFNGTGSNNFGLAAITQRHHSIFCTEVAHLYVDESTAPESFIGCRIYVVPSDSGKIIPQGLRNTIKRAGDIHHPQPKVVTITQPTEYGTVYTIEELKELKSICIENNMLLHVDGARYFNAAVALNKNLKAMTNDVGVDVLTLGGTKVGMMFGEAVIFFYKNPDHRHKYNLKRSMQLASKNRFISTQFTAILKNDLWKKLAAHTNNLAKEFEKRIAAVPSITVAHPVETNAVFLKMPVAIHEKMQEHVYFYYWNELKEEVRLIFSFDNTIEEIDQFIDLLNQYTKA